MCTQIQMELMAAGPRALVFMRRANEKKKVELGFVYTLDALRGGNLKKEKTQSPARQSRAIPLRPAFHALKKKVALA